MKEFFGFGGYSREPEGYLSWQHLLFVGSLLITMTILAVVIGKKNKDKSPKEKNQVLIISALLIDGFEIFKIFISCLKKGGVDGILYNLPLFLCSIQLITIPLAAFSKGRIKEAATDFVFIFGLMGAVIGTIGAAQNYNTYPVLTLNNVVSGITHCISGFCSLYILFAKMTDMKKKNISITLAILTLFCILAYVANVALDYNYMFLMRGDGTPYDILYNLFDGNEVLYPLSVALLSFLYITAFYYVFYLIKGKNRVSIACEKNVRRLY